jgi:hypothetical protein
MRIDKTFKSFREAKDAARAHALLYGKVFEVWGHPSWFLTKRGIEQEYVVESYDHVAPITNSRKLFMVGHAAAVRWAEKRKEYMKFKEPSDG